MSTLDRHLFKLKTATYQHLQKFKKMSDQRVSHRYNSPPRSCYIKHTLSLLSSAFILAAVSTVSSTYFTS